MEAQEFGAKIRELRIKARLTQRQLAEKANIDFTYLSKIENGVLLSPSEKVIFKLAEVLNADKDELITLGGRIPADIAKMLKNREALQFLRSDRVQKKVRASSKKGGSIPINYKSFARVAIATVLVIAVGTSLWFASPPPVRALDINFPSLPATGTLGSQYTFTVNVTIQDNEILPIQSINLKIYYAANEATYYDQYIGLSKITTADYVTYSTSGTGSNASIKASADSTWTWIHGTAYVVWGGYGYTFTPSTGY